MTINNLKKLKRTTRIQNNAAETFFEMLTVAYLQVFEKA